MVIIFFHVYWIIKITVKFWSVPCFGEWAKGSPTRGQFDVQVYMPTTIQSIAISYLKFMKKCISYLREPRNEVAQALSSAKPM